MITFFNKIGNSWVAKIICASLAISMMVFWGLGGLSNSFSVKDHEAITVGSDVISIDQINNQLNQERYKISTLTGQNISTSKAIQMGLLNQVIQQLVQEKITQKIADRIGLTASDEAVRKYVERYPLFQNNLGTFDTNLFYAYMSQLKMNQTQLSEKLKQELTQQHLSHALSKIEPDNGQLIDLMANSQKEKREITAVFLALKDIQIDHPDETTLKEYYEAYQEEFMNPEYRTIQLLSILPNNFKGEKDKAYDLMYQSIQSLEDLLGEGIPLKEAAQRLQLPLPVTLTIDISGRNKNGNIADNRLTENPILQEIFTLSEKESSSIVEYSNGFLVAEVEKITPISPKPYNTVKNQVIELWSTEQRKEKLPELVKKVTGQISQSQSWGKYYPMWETVEQTNSKHVPIELLPSLFAQKQGYQNVQSYPYQNGTWIIVVNQIIQNTTTLSQQEKDSARRMYTADLLNALQQSYAADFHVKINNTAIQKYFSVYQNDEE